MSTLKKVLSKGKVSTSKIIKEEKLAEKKKKRKVEKKRKSQKKKETTKRAQSAKKKEKRVKEKAKVVKEKKAEKPEKIVIRIPEAPTSTIDIQKYKTKLLQMKEEILQKILSERKEEMERMREESIPEPGDESDFAQKEREMEMASIFSHKDKTKLDLIESALRKIEEGTYGICEACGIQIEETRLDVIPFARYCVQCQGIKDREEDIYRETESFRASRGTGGLDIPDEES